MKYFFLNVTMKQSACVAKLAQKNDKNWKEK